MDPGAERASIVIADSIESTPLGPGYFTFSVLDETLLLSRPRLLDLDGRLLALYSHSSVLPLVFRTKL
jgi:hypothetical protein